MSTLIGPWQLHKNSPHGWKDNNSVLAISSRSRTWPVAPSSLRVSVALLASESHHTHSTTSPNVCPIQRPNGQTAYRYRLPAPSPRGISNLILNRRAPMRYGVPLGPCAAVPMSQNPAVASLIRKVKQFSCMVAWDARLARSRLAHKNVIQAMAEGGPDVAQGTFLPVKDEIPRGIVILTMPILYVRLASTVSRNRFWLHCWSAQHGRQQPIVVLSIMTA